MAYPIAVIGSGMAGLAAAYLARRAGHGVTVFEAQDSHGMDAHAMRLDGGLVDVPLRVMSPDAWPSVLQLAKEVGVGTFGVRTHASCSWTGGHTWFRSADMPVLGWLPWRTAQCVPRTASWLCKPMGTRSKCCLSNARS